MTEWFRCPIEVTGILTSSFAQVGLGLQGAGGVQVVNRVVKQLDSVLGVVGEDAGILGNKLVVIGCLEQARRPTGTYQ